MSRRPVPTEIVMDVRLWSSLKHHLVRVPDDPNEQLAFLFASPSISDSRSRLLVRDIWYASADDLDRQGPAGIAPKPEFVLNAINRCSRDGWSLIETHSHPFSTGAGTTFSWIDWDNDQQKFPTVGRLLNKRSFHATMVVGQESCDAHIFDTETKQIIPITAIVTLGVEERSGRVVYARTPTTSGLGASSAPDEPALSPTEVAERFARHAEVFGRAGQERLSRAAVGIVGLGGLGSFVATELAYLGVGRLVLIDPDRIEATNLNRLLGANERDIGELKVEALAHALRLIRSDIEVTTYPMNVVDAEALQALKGVDVIAGCVDNHGARMILNQFAVRYLLPLVDAGTGIKALQKDHGLVVGGQTQMIVPGCGCLECRGFIDAERAAFDLSSPAQQAESRAHGYGIEEPAPSVIFLNGLVASSQVAEVVYLLTGSGAPVRGGTPSYTLYDALARTMTPMRVAATPTCVTCGEDGVLAMGDLAPIIAATDPIAGSIPPLPTLDRNAADASSSSARTDGTASDVAITAAGAAVDDVDSQS